MKKLLLILFVLSAGLAKAQSIDSVSFIPNNPTIHDTVFAKLYCTRSMSANYFNRITVSINNDTVKLNTYSKLCGGYAVVTHFDTIIKICPLSKGINYFKFISCLDINNEDSSCYISPTIYCSDTLNYKLNVIQSNKRLAESLYIDIKPNPIDEFVNISLGKLYSSIDLDLMDIYGRSIQSKHFSNISELILYRNDIPAGVYLIKIVINEGETITKKVIID